MDVWVQKARLKLKAGRRGWHCSAYLDNDKASERYLSGGRKSTSNPRSMAYIRQIKPGDLIVLFQVDDESFHALAQAESAGMEADPGSRKFDSFYLKSPETAFRFAKPLTLTELHASGCEPACFGPGTNGRMFPLSLEEFVGMAKALAQVNPEQSKDLSAWLQKCS